MTGFSYKNFMLQIIQGSIILVSLIYLLNNYSHIFFENIDIFEKYVPIPPILLILFICISFIIGIMNDFFADFLESFTIKINLIKPPSYHLLKKGKRWGIELAHYSEINKNLCKIAAKYDKKNTSNYIFQVAKNIAFKKCSDYQQEQLESFFTLYIFSRNLSLSFLMVIILFVISYLIPSMPDLHWILFLILAFLFLIALFSSYRYFLYYARIMLGSTFKPNKKNTDSNN